MPASTITHSTDLQLGESQNDTSTAVLTQADATSTPGALRDGLGVVASLLCAIHCAAMPFVIGLLPLIGLGFLADAAFHQWMAVICLAIAISSFVPGWRQHRRLIPGMTAFGGIVLITAAAYSGSTHCCPTANAATTGSSAGSDNPHTSACLVEGCNSACTGTQANDENSDDQRVFGTHTGVPTVAGFGAWLTPFGGLLLIAAHLLNRFLICRCSCASTCNTR
ncbi:MAG: MerC domain-containing protein [Phycisphaerales bacterium]|nr:MerC domain-containing protein [Phycisphaerales bacterium]